MSVTAVPLRPIRKGALVKLWVGLALALAAAGGLAWAGTSRDNVKDAAAGIVTTPSGLRYQVIRPGTGPTPTDSDVVLLGYKGALTDGTVFDEAPQTSFPVAGVVPGFSEGLKLMQRGGKYRLWIPPALGYGDQSPDPARLPPNSELVFDVDLVDFRSIAQLQAEMEQMQRLQGALPGQPGQPPAPQRPR